MTDEQHIGDDDQAFVGRVRDAYATRPMTAHEARDFDERLQSKLTPRARPSRWLAMAAAATVVAAVLVAAWPAATPDPTTPDPTGSVDWISPIFAVEDDVLADDENLPPEFEAIALLIATVPEPTEEN